MPAIIAHTLIAPALARFREQHPDARVHLVIAEAPAGHDPYDAIIATGPVDAHTTRHSRLLASMPEVLCASQEFLAVHGEPVSPWDLNGEHCIGIVDDARSPRAWSFRRGHTEVKVVPASPLAFSDTQSAVATAVRGGGVVLVPSLAVEAQIAAGLLTPLMQDWSTPQHAIWFQQRVPLTGPLETFAEFVADLMPSM